VLREIDANFAADRLPEELAPLREQLGARLRADEASSAGGEIPQAAA